MIRLPLYVLVKFATQHIDHVPVSENVSNDSRQDAERLDRDGESLFLSFCFVFDFFARIELYSLVWMGDLCSRSLRAGELLFVAVEIQDSNFACGLIRIEELKRVRFIALAGSSWFYGIHEDFCASEIRIADENKGQGKKLFHIYSRCLGCGMQQ